MPTPIEDSSPKTAAELPVIPGYEVLSEIGRSGAGIVYVARDTTLNYEVAVKMPSLLAPRADTESRFFRTAQIAAQLQHPGIPPIFDVGTLSDGRPFLVMKLIKGQTLAKMLAERPRPITDRIRFLSVFEHVCQAVAYAHAHHVIHRDLKPQHVMIGAFGEVQVIGWGLATVLAGKESGPPNGELLGTPAYMPPEQARGEWNKVDCRADVFALGGILIEILTGRPTFSVDSVAEVIQNAASGDLSEAFARLDACGEDAELIALAKRCLSPNLAYRPADAGELAALVSAYRGGIDERLRKSEAERLAAVAIAAEKGKRRQVQLALLLVAGMFIIWTGALVWWQDRQTTVRRILEKEREADEKLAQKGQVPPFQKRPQPEKKPAPKPKPRMQVENTIQDDHIAPPPREMSQPDP
jgi:eukaryotic-like serine/threonine-protein kinase